MRQEVYTKFAEALQRKQAEQAAAVRHDEVVAKFAEALDRQMAQKQAEEIYCEGFCKAAELAGVDPNSLVKQALGLGGLLSLGQKAVGAAKAIGGSAKAVGQQAAGGTRQLGSRYLELLKGGNKKTLMKPNDALIGSRTPGGRTKWIKQPTYARAMRGIDKSEGVGGVRKAIARFSVNQQGRAGAYGSDVASELRKVLAARLGAGAAATGAAGAGIAAATGGDQK